MEPTQVITVELLREPVPPRATRGAWKSERIAEVLDSLPVGEVAAEIGIGEGPMRDHIYRYRKAKGSAHRFIVRSVGRERCRVWRIA